MFLLRQHISTSFKNGGPDEVMSIRGGDPAVPRLEPQQAKDNSLEGGGYRVIHQEIDPVEQSVATHAPPTKSFSSQQQQQHRLEFYKQHYGYKPPSPRSTKHENCTQHVSGDWEWFGLNAKERSRGNEDRTIYEWFFKDLKEKGTYLELGAFNGVSESNSRFFDECLEWEGLLIEANPKLKKSILQTRPHPHKLFFAASCVKEDANETIRFVQGSSNGHVARSAKAKQDRRAVDVACGPLSPVIETLFNGHINFFSLDVEGAEAQVLQTVDWNKVRVDVMISESINNHCGYTCTHRSKVRQIMKEAGYLLFVNGVYRSDLFLHPSVQQRPPQQYHQGYTDVMQNESSEVWPLPN